MEHTHPDDDVLELADSVLDHKKKQRTIARVHSLFVKSVFKRNELLPIVIYYNDSFSPDGATLFRIINFNKLHCCIKN